MGRWVIVLLACAAGAAAAAEPAYFDLTAEIRRTLVLRAEPGRQGRRLGEIPAGATGIENKGCRGASDEAWEHLSRELRAAMANERWCRVRYRGVEGWASVRFLKASSAPSRGAEAAAGSAATTAAAPAAARSVAPFTGIEWRPAAIGDLQLRATPAWIRFGDSGELEGNTGCNSLRAYFVAGSTALRIGPLVLTRMACPGETQAVLERALIAALEAAEAQRVEAGVFHLFDANGRQVAQFRSEQR